MEENLRRWYEVGIETGQMSIFYVLENHAL